MLSFPHCPVQAFISLKETFHSINKIQSFVRLTKSLLIPCQLHQRTQRTVSTKIATQVEVEKEIAVDYVSVYV